MIKVINKKTIKNEHWRKYRRNYSIAQKWKNVNQVMYKYFLSKAIAHKAWSI